MKFDEVMSIDFETDELIRKARVFQWIIINIILCIDEVIAISKIDEELINAKKASEFLYAAQNAMVYRYTMEIAKLFDSESKSVNFSSFKNELAQEGFKSENLEKYKEKIKKYKNDIKSIKKRRHKILAHNDLEYFYDIKKCNCDYRLDLSNILDLMRTMLMICNDYLEYKGYSNLKYDIENNHNDVKHLFE